MKKNTFFLVALITLWCGFALATPLVPPYDVKWSQAPDMDQGVDYLSMHRSGGPIVADDFQSDGRDIYGFHWWGSYLTDPRTGQEFDTGQGLERNVSFEISFHRDCPAGDVSCVLPGEPAYNYSTPSNAYTAIIVDVEEDFFGTTAGGENVYEYWALLPSPWEEIAGETYWVDFGWNAGQFNTAIGDDVWGWHESSEHWNDFAVTTNVAVGGNPHAGTWAVIDGKDMAFEVLTVPEPGSIALMALGLLGFGVTRSRKKTQ